MTQPLMTRAGVEARVHLHDGQSRAWTSDRRFVFVVAGTQSGKTSFGPYWLHREIQRSGAGDYLAVTATYDLFKLKMLPEMVGYFCDLSGWGTFQAVDRVIVSKDGKSRIILRSANAPGGLESATAKAAWIDECGQEDFTREAWEAVQRRLSLSQGRVLGTTTPYNLGWLKVDVFDRWKGGDPDYDVIQFASTMNPQFSLAEYERARKQLPSWKFEMFYNGNFSRPAGLIYGDYDEAIHCVRAFSIPQDWPRTVGVDFGGTEHTALLWIADDPQTGNHYVYREALGGGLSGAEHARAAAEYREPVRVAYGGARSEDEHRRTWAMAGFPVAEPLISEVEAGIDRVIGLFRQNRLFVFETLTGLRSELGAYSRELDAAGEPTQRIAGKERYHRLDALRYACSGYALKPVIAHRTTEEELEDIADYEDPVRNRASKFY